MRISVIVATYNRAALLAECLHHLSRQHFEPHDEVIVVDNGSTDDTPRVIADAQDLFPIPLRHLAEPAPGKSRAIAAALAIAGGDVLAFTDDDVDVDPGWLNAIRCVMSDGRIALAGGPVTPRWEATPPTWLRRSVDEYSRLAAPLGLLSYGPQSCPLGARTVLGANLVVRAAVLRRLGGYAPHLGKLRGTLLSGEDHELCMRVQSAGFRAVYSPQMTVTHWVPAARMRARYSLSWFFWSGITHAVLEAGETPARSLLGVPRHFVKRILASGAHSLGAALRGQTARMMDHATDVMFIAGYMARRWGIRGAHA